MRKNGACLLLLMITALVFNAQGAHDRDAGDDAILSHILKNCAQYCSRLANASLHFVCEEKVKEEIFEPYLLKTTRREPTMSKTNTEIFYSLDSRKIGKNECVYDYQLIRKKGKISETRTLLLENGKKKHTPNAPVKTTFFTYKYIIFGPIGLFGESAQKLYDYSLLKEQKKYYVIDVKPKDNEKNGNLYGKAWISKGNFSISRVEWEQESIGNFEKLEKNAQWFGGKPKVHVVSEFENLKSGLRFPSRYYIQESYSTREPKPFVRSKLEVTFKNYKYFVVETTVKYGRFF